MAKEKARKKKCKVRSSLYQEEQGLSEELHEDLGVEKLLRAGDGASEDVESACSGVATTERFKLRKQVAAAAGKHSTTSLSLFMEASGLDVEEELSTLATQYWAEAVWIGKWCL